LEAVGWRGLLALVAGLAGGTFLWAQVGGDGPLSIQRVVLRPDRVAKELEKVQQGTLVLVPLKDFDDRVERIRKAQLGRDQKPHLTRAVYAAELIDRSLANGSGQWTVLYDGTGPAVLPMDPLNLALAKVRWEQEGDAILADFDGKSPGLLVKQAGACLFEWTARGTPTSEGLTFSLAVPACAITSFEFKLPADHWLLGPKGAAVTGPFDTESPGKRLWRMQVAGAAPIEFSVRKISDQQGPAALVAQVHSVQKLTPDKLEVEHDFQIDVLRGSVRELVLEGDAVLQPFAVSLPGSEVMSSQWQEIPAKKDAKGKVTSGPKGELTIRFQQPLQGKIQGLRVKSLASRPLAGPWTSPMLRVRGALPRGETVQLRLHPDLAIGKWDHGTFQLIQIATEADGTQVVTLAQTAVEPALARPPTLTPPAKTIDVHATEIQSWHITPAGALRSAEIVYSPAQGNLFELRLRLPKTAAGYRLESVDMQPAELLGDWHPDGDFLVVHLKQALGPGKKAALKLRLQADFRDITTGMRDLSYPDIEPMDGTRREGTLAIAVDPVFRAQLAPPALAPAALDDAEQRPGAPSFLFNYREQRPGVVIRIVPQPVHVQWHGKHAIALTDKEASLHFRWEVRPLAGAPEFLDLRLARGFPSTWKISTPEDAVAIRHWERLPLQETLPHLLTLGSGHGLQAAAVEALTPGGTYWRFHLAEPLRKKTAFNLVADLAAGAGRLDNAWTIPLAEPVQRAQTDQEIQVTSPGAPISKIAAGASVLVDKMPAQAHIQHAGPLEQLTVWTRPEKRPASQLELCDQAQLATYVYKDGRVYRRLQFRLWQWRDRTCDLHLPSEWQVLAVKVGDQWLSRLDLAETRGGVRLTLPVDQNTPFVSYEVVARDAESSGLVPGFLTVPIPDIVWPAAPLDFRARLFLEDGWMPLAQGSLDPVGVPASIARQSSSPRLLRQMWDFGRTWWPHSADADLLADLDAQKQIVLQAEAKLRGGDHKSLKLSDALERLALDHLRAETPLLIDRMAFRALRLAPETPLTPSALSPQAGRPFWESLGLVYVASRNGALLTSPQRLQALGMTGPLPSAALDAALQEAILHGRDSSGGFVSAPIWPRLPLEDTELVPGQSGSMERASDFPVMTEWEFRADETGPLQIHLVDPLAARVVGWALAGVWAFGLWQLHRVLGPRPHFRVCVFLVVAAILAAIWAPGNLCEFLVVPMLLTTLIAFLACLLRFLGSHDPTAAAARSTVTQPPATTTALLVLLAVGWALTAQAQPPAPRTFTVFVVEGAKPGVLAPPDLLARMSELENQAGPATSGAVLVSAKYSGKVKDAQARVEAVFELQNFKEQTNLIIPLSGVQLSEAFLDGAPVYPAAHKAGFSVPIRDKGAHTLRLAFSVRAVGDGDQFDLRFTVPKLLQSELRFEGLQPSHKLHALHCFGEERWLPEPPQPAKIWQAQLGYESVIHVRWTGAAGLPAPKTIEVREAHFWDLHPASPALTSSLTYAIGKGSVGQFSIALPERLHVRGIEASTTPAAPIVIKQWSVIGKGDQRRLLVELTQPMSGVVTLNLELVPLGGGPAGKVVLLLPAPLQGKSVGGLLGYRHDAVEIKGIAQNLAVQSMPTDDFERQWKKQSVPVSRAYSFQRKAAKAWLELVTQPNAWQTQGQIDWTVDQGYADLLGKFTLTSPQADLMFVEFFVDKTLTLAEVAGPDVRRWHLQDSLLQVWLRQPRKATTLTLTGWRIAPPQAKTLALPAVYPLRTQFAGQTLAIRGAPGVHVELDQVKRLRSIPAAGKLQFAVEEPQYEISVRVPAATRPPPASTLLKVRPADRGMEIEQIIRLTTQRGRLPTLQLHLHDWPADAVLEAPGGTLQPIKSKTLKHPAWTLTYPPGLPGVVTATVRGRIGGGHQGAALPRVELQGADLRDQLLAWQDVDVEDAGTGKKLAPQKSAQEKIARAPAGAWLNDAASWHGAAAVHSLRAAPAPAPAKSSIHVLASSEWMRLTGGRWLHEASYWLHAPESTEMCVKFPAALEGVSVWVDGRLQLAAGPPAADVVLPLDAAQAPRHVEMRWKYPPDLERLDMPNVGGVRVEQAVLPAHQRLVWVPPGRSAVNAETHATLVPRILHEARGHMEIAASLAQEPARTDEITRRIAERQRSFFACTRLADYTLALAKQVRPDLPASWQEQLQALRRTNAELAKERGYEAQRQAAMQTREMAVAGVARDSYPQSGLPLLLTGNAPGLTLTAAETWAIAGQQTNSYLLALGAILLVLLSPFRHSWSILRLAAPEIAIAVMAAAMAVFGVSMLAIVLVCLLIALRVVWIVAAVKHRFLAPESVASHASHPSTPSAPK
jgi:hypothetical protein